MHSNEDPVQPKLKKKIPSSGSLFWLCNYWNIAILETLMAAAAAAAATAKLLQSSPTLCNPIDGSPPGFPVPGILQARTLEWIAFSFSNAGK